MRMACLGVLLLTGSAAMGQTTGSAPELTVFSGQPATASTAALVLSQPGLQPQTTLPSQFFVQRPADTRVFQPLKSSTAQENFLAENHPLQLAAPAANHGQAGMIPIPTQWPQAKMEAIPTRWPDLKFVPLKAATPTSK